MAGYFFTAVVFLLLGVVMAHARWHDDGPPRLRERGLAIQSHLDQIGPGAALVIGDSIVERQAFGTLCGLPVINAGIGRATAEDALAFGPMVSVRAKPAITIVAIGTNDSMQRRASADFRRDFRLLLDRTMPDMVVGVRDPRIDALIQSEADRAGAAYVPPEEPAAIQTVDGVHPSPLGARSWQAAIERHCPGKSAATGDQPRTMP